MSNLWTPGGERSAAGNNFGANFKLDLPGIESATQQLGGLNSALDGLKKSLRDLGSNSYSLTSGINSMLDSIAKKAATTTTSLTGLSAAVGGMGSGGGTASGPAAPTGGGGTGNWTSGATASAATAVAAAGGGGGGGGAPPSGIDLTGMLGTNQSGKGLVQDMMMFPLRFMRDSISTNRQTALNASAAMSMNSFATGASTKDIMTQLSRFPGSVLGQPSDLLSLFGAAPGYGASYNFGGGPNAPRTGGYLAGVRQAQMLNPGASVGEIASTIGGFASNTGAQQQAQVMTGGAFGMIKPGGGGQKSLSEWAESILRWLEGLRGGADRGKPFNYGELMAQYFPGSNIDAWFDANAVPQNMREYWWTYALGKSKSTGSTAAGNAFQITPEKQSVAWNRLNASSSLTQTQFGLAGTMAGSYANKEVANKWMNDVMGAFQQQVIPSAVSSGPLNFMQFLPDTIEQLMMSMLERSGKFGSLLGGVVGYGSASKGFFDNALSSVGGMATAAPGALAGGASTIWDSLFGDVGDVYTTTGGTGVGGLHPSMQNKLSAMMQANPRLRVNSGLRDNAMQQRLKKRGVGRVSGRPSAHTRGMAADLGPSSEYPWIVQNARKFGLSSGAGQGEPWHVGMGDIGDGILDDLSGAGPFSTILSGLVDLISGGIGGNSDTVIGGIGGLVPGLLSFLGGAISGKGGVNQANLMFKEDLYSMLYDKSKNVTTGGIFSSVRNMNTGATVSAGVAGGAGVGAGMSGGARSALYGGYVTPQSEMGALTSGNEMTRGAAVAKALYQAGFRGQDLKNMVAISYRESHWTSPWVSDNDDVGGGLFGINQLPWLKKGLTPPYSKADILDPYANAQIAYDMFNGKVPGQGKSGYAPWTMPGGTWRDSVPFDKGIAAVAQAGLGDVDYGSYSPAMTSAPTLHQINFHNTFTVGGGGGGAGGIDLRRTVSTIADHLENEMKQRLARTS